MAGMTSKLQKHREINLCRRAANATAVVGYITLN